MRFKNQGLDLIEVQDNGSGIPPASYPSVALKHHTSKLSSYADIGSLGTFGFRGEALASLCALSTMTITTCLAEDVPKGTKLTFEASGKLSGTSVVASQRGTTVSVEKLFHNLPVRRRELDRNIKREWHKVISLLNQYACIQTNTKFVVSQQPTKGKRIVLFSTKGNLTTRDNIINIFGAKTMTALVPLDMKMEMQPSTLSSALQSTVGVGTISKEVRIVGHVSRPSHGDGRQTPDRQMFFINGRPCGLPQFAKTFNEVYKSYNSTQSPFIFADIQLDTHMYDVNVSPDKRTILLHDQSHLLENIRSSLVDIFDSHDYSLTTSQLARPNQAPAQTPTPSRMARPPRSNHRDEADYELPSTTPDLRDAPSRDGEAARSRRATPRDPASNGATESENARNPLHRWLNLKGAEEEEGEEHEEEEGEKTEEEEEEGENSSSNPEARLDEEPHEESSRRAGSEASEFSEPAVPSASTDAVACASVSDSEAGQAKDPDQDEEEGTQSGVHSVSEPSATKSEVPPDLSPRNRGFQSSIPSVRITPRTARFGQPRARPSPPKQAPEPVKVIIGHSRRQNKSYGKAMTAEEAEIEDEEDEYQSGSSEGEEDDGIYARESRSPDAGKPSFGSALSQRFAAGGAKGYLPPSQESLPRSGTRIRSRHAGDSNLHYSLGDPASTPANDAGSDEEIASEAESSAEEGENEDVEDEEASVDENSPIRDPTKQDERRTPGMQPLETGSRSKYATLRLTQNLIVDTDAIRSGLGSWSGITPRRTPDNLEKMQAEDITAADAESKLSLIISKSDFAKMRVAGQFNLGFIIAVRPGESGDSDDPTGMKHDELFIIDQHASDEKYNFERLQDKTVVQSQRLVHPKRLELTALEEEIVMQSTDAIEANGFKVDVDMDGDWPVGSRCQLTALPLSRETTFDIADLEELIALLADESAESKHVPRPSKVRKMFAMRACRSSIMIGRPLTQHQMYGLVGHMGELDKPWNCPHGRPTMRHLCRMQTWDKKGWAEDVEPVPLASWASY